MAELYSVLIPHDEGRKLFNEVPRTPKERAEALTKAGIALVEAGRYEEAKECFAKAKELEGKDTPQKQEKQTGKKTQVLFDGEEKAYPCEFILE